MSNKKANNPAVTFQYYRYVLVLLTSNDINLDEFSHSHNKIKNFSRHYISASIGPKCWTGPAADGDVSTLAAIVGTNCKYTLLRHIEQVWLQL
jgi:hypothetical protein